MPCLRCFDSWLLLVAFPMFFPFLLPGMPGVFQWLNLLLCLPAKA